MKLEICYNAVKNIYHVKCKHYIKRGTAYMKINLRKLRLQEGLTIRELSTKSRVSIATISKIENHEIQPTISTICKLCSALGVTICKMVECERYYYDDEEW